MYVPYNVVGRFNYKNLSVYTQLDKSKCIALRYVDDSMKPTEDYPMNPNGSKCMHYIILL